MQFRWAYLFHYSVRSAYIFFLLSIIQRCLIYLLPSFVILWDGRKHHRFFQQFRGRLNVFHRFFIGTFAEVSREIMPHYHRHHLHRLRSSFALKWKNKNCCKCTMHKQIGCNSDFGYIVRTQSIFSARCYA